MKRGERTERNRKVGKVRDDVKGKTIVNGNGLIMVRRGLTLWVFSSRMSLVGLTH